MKKIDLCRKTFVILATSLVLLTPTVYAQEKALRVIVPLTTGSTVDIMARAMAPSLTKAFGQPVVIENLPGAGGVTGTAQLVRAPKDGQTIAMISSNHVINPGIYKSMPFDSVKDVSPVMVFGIVPLVLVVTNSFPAKSLKELVALAKSKPGQFNYGSAGNGSVLHLAGELLKQEAGIFVTHIPYRGTGPLVTDIIGGQVDMGFLSVTAAAAQIKAGKLRAIGVSTNKRSNVLPDVPTLAEMGLPNYSFDAWLAVIAPAGVAKQTLEQIHQKMLVALGTQEVQQAMTSQGITPLNIGPDQGVAFFTNEVIKHGQLVKRSGAIAE